MIKVSHISYSLNMGGLEKMLLSLAAGINKEEFDVSVCCLSDHLGLKDEFDHNNIPVYTCPKKPGIDISIPWRLSQIFKQRGVELVHTHNPTALLYAGVAAKLAGIPCVHTEHSNLHSDRWKLMLAERIVLNFVNTIICDTEEVKQEVNEKHKIVGDHVQVVFNGVDITRFKPSTTQSSLRSQLGIDDNDFIIGTVGRLAEVKNQKSMIDCVDILASRYNNIKLVLVGDGELRASLQEHAKSKGIEDKVLLLGERNDIPELLAMMDTFLLVSHYEGMSIALLEAMASGKPAIATNVGGNPELIHEGKTGFLVPVDSPDTIAEAVEKLYSNPELTKTMSANARSCVADNFSLQTMVNEYEAIYKKAII